MGPFPPRLGRLPRASRPRPSPTMLRGLLRLLPVATLLAWQLAMAGPAQAKAGDLDPSFGSGGKVSTDLGTALDEASGVVEQADGKLAVAGFAGEGTSRDFGVARYHPDGTLDPSFGSGGKVTTDFYGFTDHAQGGLVVQPDGKLVAAGSAFTFFTGGNYDFALARYNPDGTLDPSFGSGGKVTTDLAGSFDEAFAVALQPDGKIVLGGYAQTGLGLDFGLARYNPDGTLDPSFGGGNGTATNDFAGGDDRIEALVVQADGKLVAAGQSSSGGSADFALARYNPDGTLDPSFGTGGKVTTDLGGGTDFVVAVARQADGKLVAAGSGFTGASGDFALARYNPDGILDPSFGTGGKVTTDFAGGDDVATGLAVQRHGKLVAGGYRFSGGVRDIALAGYKPNGTLDPSFGTGGKVTTDFAGGTDNGAGAMAMQTDGKLVTAGWVDTGAGEDWALARYRG